MILFLYQPLIENARFYRIFCLVLLLFIIFVLAYLVYLSQLYALWLIILFISMVALAYWIYLCQLPNERILEKAEHWIVLHNEKLQKSAYGTQGNALMVLILILPFVMLTWAVYSFMRLFK